MRLRQKGRPDCARLHARAERVIPSGQNLRQKERYSANTKGQIPIAIAAKFSEDEEACEVNCVVVGLIAEIV
jgi:hypothetical protein